MELQHFSHDHPLILKDQAKDGDSSIIKCYGCRKYDFAEAYECKQCNFVLHKSCAELPSKILLFSHPQHSLTLLSKSPYGCRQRCNICSESISGFIYHCYICDYDSDIMCVLLGKVVNPEGCQHSFMPIRSWSFNCGACEKTGDGMCYMCSTCHLMIHKHCASSHPKTNSSFHNFNLPSTFPTIQNLSLDKSPTSNLQNTTLDPILDLDPLSENNLVNIKLQHFWHQHLFHYGDAKDQKDLYGIDYMKCYLCREEITEGPIYGCGECRFFIHKVCSEFPINTRIPLHPMHLLILKRNDANECCCSLCNRDISKSSFRYWCSSGCGFDLHMQCAFENTFVQFAKNHKHTFINFKPTLFTCDGCGIHKKNECASCICSICQLQVHMNCKNSFQLSLTQRRHPHELKLTYSFEIDFDFEFVDKFCKICSKKMNSVLCMYQCNNDDCTYLAHAACASSEKLVVQNTQEVDERKEIEMEEVITHFSHPHQLISSNDEPKIDEPPKICYGCVRPISLPFYTCGSDECTFFLHQQCAYLPKIIQQHPLHDHPLVLKDFPDLSVYNIFWGFYCHGCYGQCNGFAYTCMECPYYHLDVGCGLFKETLRHESHDCTLTLISNTSDKKTCRACESDSDTGFWCEDHPDFFLDLKCASFPTSVGHDCPDGIKWIVKPLKLRYDCIEHVDGQYYCDLCEETRGKDHWFYHCEDCHNCIHPQCLLGKYRIKYGDTFYNIAKLHPHTLCVAKKPVTDPPCGHCGMPCMESPLGFCPTCNIYFHAEYECFKYEASFYNFPKVHPHAVCIVKKPRTDPLCDTCREPCEDMSSLVFCPTCNIYFHPYDWQCFKYQDEEESKPFIKDYFAAAQ